MARAAGFILAGGNSTRMGRDKALLPFGGSTLLENVAAWVRSVGFDVAVIGPPERYGHLGLEIIPDAVTGCGPLGGLYTALSQDRAEWNLVVACDMPNLKPDLFRHLLAVADGDGAVPQTTHGFEPLCAVYHRRVAAAASRAIAANQLKMQTFISDLDMVRWPAPDPDAFANWNVPEQVSHR